jgi:hypothetical protein
VTLETLYDESACMQHSLLPCRMLASHQQQNTSFKFRFTMPEY